MIVEGTLLLDSVANSHLNQLVPCFRTAIFPGGIKRVYDQMSQPDSLHLAQRNFVLRSFV